MQTSIATPIATGIKCRCSLQLIQILTLITNTTVAAININANFHLPVIKYQCQFPIILTIATTIANGIDCCSMLHCSLCCPLCGAVLCYTLLPSFCAVLLPILYCAALLFYAALCCSILLLIPCCSALLSIPCCAVLHCFLFYAVLPTYHYYYNFLTKVHCPCKKT
jgi:hypothetical protein